jgi:hypothetical protein
MYQMHGIFREEQDGEYLALNSMTTDFHHLRLYLGMCFSSSLH